MICQQSSCSKLVYSGLKGVSYLYDFMRGLDTSGPYAHLTSTLQARPFSQSFSVFLSESEDNRGISRENMREGNWNIKTSGVFYIVTHKKEPCLIMCVVLLMYQSRTSLELDSEPLLLFYGIIYYEERPVILFVGWSGGCRCIFTIILQTLAFIKTLLAVFTAIFLPSHELFKTDFTWGK